MQLLELRRVSRGSWQPVFGLAPEPFDEHQLSKHNFFNTHYSFRGMIIPQEALNFNKPFEDASETIRFRMVGSSTPGIPVRGLNPDLVEDPASQVQLACVTNFRTRLKVSSRIDNLLLTDDAQRKQIQVARHRLYDDRQQINSDEGPRNTFPSC